ncbi:MAG: hypothetical protein K0R49_1057, partial [Burkholderiales bacterium]|nr:hypothetical protein [Burkholderiales bacterium]
MKKIIFSIIFLSWLFILNSCSSGGGNPPRTVSTNSTITSFSINNATGI